MHQVAENFPFFPESVKFVTQVVKMKKFDCKRLALEENNEGFTPLNAVFYEMSNKLGQRYFARNYGNTNNDEGTYLTEKLYPEALTAIR